MTFDIIVLTEDRYWNPDYRDDYINNLLLEDNYLLDALKACGLKCARLPWSYPAFDWHDTKTIIFRTTWDYFDRFGEFSQWLEKVKSQTHLINSYDMIRWNIDKHYLQDLEQRGINIPPTQFIEIGDTRTLEEWQDQLGWDPFILKPAVSGAGRHTYKLNRNTLREKESIFQNLIQKESFLIQDFIPSVPEKGEVSFIMINGQFTHAVLKKAKEGDFRVQDDFGGTVHPYQANEQEIKWAKSIFQQLDELPVYGRVDAIWDKHDQLCVSELELIEPELWFRFYPESAKLLARSCREKIQNL